MIEFTQYIPFEGATASIRPMNKTTKQPLRMHIFTPPFCTNFPHLTVDTSIITNATTTVDAVKRMSKYLDLSMFGQGVIQIEFRRWMLFFVLYFCVILTIVLQGHARRFVAGLRA